MEIEQKRIKNKPLRVKKTDIQKKTKEKKVKQKKLKKLAMSMKKKQVISSDQSNSKSNNTDGNLIKKVAAAGSLKINEISSPKIPKRKKKVFARKNKQMSLIRFPSQIKDEEKRIIEVQSSPRTEKKDQKKNYVQAPSVGGAFVRIPSQDKDKQTLGKLNPTANKNKTSRKNKKDVDPQHKRTLYFRFPSEVKNKFDVKKLYRGIQNVHFSKSSKSWCFVRFETEELAARARKALHHTVVPGGKLFVKRSDRAKQQSPQRQSAKLYVTNLPDNINWRDIKSAIPRGKNYHLQKETKSAVITFRNKNILESIIKDTKKRIVCGVEVSISDSKPGENGNAKNVMRKKQGKNKSNLSKENSDEEKSDSDNEEGAEEHLDEESDSDNEEGAEEHLDEKSKSDDEVAMEDSGDEKSESDDDEDDNDDGGVENSDDDKSTSDNNEDVNSVDNINENDGKGEENIDDDSDSVHNNGSSNESIGDGDGSGDDDGD